jgi:multiple sugar transport system substrate-binding protein
MKKAFMLFAVFAFSVCLFAAEKVDNQKGKIAIWLGYPETLPAFEATKKKFNDKYPNIQVEILTFTLREFESKLASSMPTGLGPDLMVMHDFIFQRYYGNGYLEQLPADQNAIVADPKKIDQVYKTIVERNGKLYGIPYWTGKRSLFYNIDHFKEAGMKNPPASMEELWEYAAKLTKKDANGALTRAGITLRLTGASGVFQKLCDFFYQETGKQFLEPGKKYGTIKVVIKDNLDAAAKTLLDHVNHLHGSTKVDDWALKHDSDAFSAGISSMLMRETWVIKFIEKNNPKLNYGVAYVPHSKFNGAFNYVETLSVNKDSKLKGPSWDFARMLQDQDMLNVLLNESGYLPLRKDRNFSDFLSKNPKYKTVMIPRNKNYVSYFEPANIAYEEVTTRCGEIIQKAFADASLLNNKEGCKAVMLNVQKKAEQILKEQDILAE